MVLWILNGSEVLDESKLCSEFQNHNILRYKLEDFPDDVTFSKVLRVLGPSSENL